MTLKKPSLLVQLPLCAISDALLFMKMCQQAIEFRFGHRQRVAVARQVGRLMAVPMAVLPTTAVVKRAPQVTIGSVVVPGAMVGIVPVIVDFVIGHRVEGLSDFVIG